MQIREYGLNIVNDNKFTILFLGIIALFFMSVATFLYFHPHVPITLPDATICKAYKIKSEDEILGKWMNIETHKPGSRPNLTGSINGPKLDQYRWISSGPVNCDVNSISDIKNTISNPWIYERLKMEGTIFSPQYAYKLIGASGSEIILIDIHKGIFEIEKFNKKGEMVKDSDLIQCDHRRNENRQWLSQLQKTFPDDKELTNIKQSLHRNSN